MESRKILTWFFLACLAFAAPVGGWGEEKVEWSAGDPPAERPERPSEVPS